MPIIKKITVQQKNKDRYNIFFDVNGNEQYAFSVSEDVLIKHGLRKGMELTELDIAELSFNEDIQKAYNSAIHYLSFRMRSEKEVRDHLAEKDYDEEIINEVIQRLRKNQFLNDEEFANAFVRTQINTSDKGPIQITRSLQEKGIHSTIIESAIVQFTFNQQQEKAQILCEKWLKSKGKNRSRVQKKQDLHAMLARKGYPKDVIISVIELAIENSEDDDDDEWSGLVLQGEKALKKYASELDVRKRILKIKQFLYRKGYQMDMIERFVNEKIVEDN